MIFEDLNAFVIVARHGSFARASVELCVAQSALSKRVRRLEHRVGALLLERRARGVVLTEAGRAFLTRANRLVDEVADMERNLSSVVQTPSGEVRVAIPQRTCGLLAPPLIERCQQELPLVQLHIQEGTPVSVHGSLLRGEADIALIYNPELGAEFWVKPFLVEPLYLIVPSAQTAARRGLEIPDPCGIADLARLPLILPKKPNSVRVLVERQCAGHGLRPNIVYETDGTHTMRGMVERGMGVSVFSLSAWSYAIAAGTLRGVRFSSPVMNWKLAIVRTRKDVSAVAINRVEQVLEQEMGALLDSGGWPGATRPPRDVRPAQEGRTHAEHD